MSGRNSRNGSRWSPPRWIVEPSTAKNASRPTPSQSAHSPQARVSSTSVSPTSKTTARTVTGALPSARALLPGDAAEALAGQLEVLLAGPLVDLLHAPQVEAIDQDRVD